MSLPSGSRLGPYEIVSLLGAGGMGEVYRARDTRLDRTVAIKVLPENVSGDPERRQRFEREARTVSSLSHPHICALYDVGRHDGTDFLVMEYLEGQALSDRLAKGPLPMEQVLRYGVEIADALDQAHRHGVVHRDLKPGNIMLTKSGAKLLDFGLAKTHPAAPVGSALSQMPTGTQPLTAEGTLLGTFQYMAPEQLEGREADARTDIFGFGTVLYEMATGRKAFTGRSPASLIASILSSDPPPIRSLQPLSPPALDRLVRTCLAKDREERWQSAHDLVSELRWIAEGPSVAPVRAGRERRWRLAAALAVGAAVAAGLAGYRLGRGTTPSPRPLMRFVTALPPGQVLSLGRGSALALSPDGRRLVYLATQGAVPQLYARSLDRLEGSPLAGTEGADSPFFSPDGEWVGFFAGGKLRKVPMEGGSGVTLCDAPEGRGGAWGSDDTIVFAPGGPAGAGLFRVPARGGEPQALTTLDATSGEGSHRWPQVLPGGKAVLFTVGLAGGTSFDEARIGVVSLETGKNRMLSERGHYARHVPTGHLVFTRAATLLAAPFDLGRLEVRGSAVPVLEGIRTNASGGAHFTFSDLGSLVYVPGGAAEAERTMVWVDRQGKATPVTETRRDFLWPRLSPDGQRIAVSIRSGVPDIWVHDLARGSFSRLTSGPGNRSAPTWTPDGSRLAYFSGIPGRSASIFWKPADGSGAEELLTTTGSQAFSLSWSPDGQLLAFDERAPAQGWDVWILPLSGDRKAQPLVRTAADELSPAFSPDGRWLAYQSNETGRFEVYVQAFPGPGGRWQVSNEGGNWPVWARDGRELFYRARDKMMAVEIAPGPSFRAGRPRLLFEGRYLDSLYDVSPDGQRFVLIKPGEEGPPPSEVNVVLEWFSELADRVRPGGG